MKLFAAAPGLFICMQKNLKDVSIKNGSTKECWSIDQTPTGKISFISHPFGLVRRVCHGRGGTDFWCLPIQKEVVAGTFTPHWDKKKWQAVFLLVTRYSLWRRKLRLQIIYMPLMRCYTYLSEVAAQENIFTVCSSLGHWIIRSNGWMASHSEHRRWLFVFLMIFNIAVLFAQK